MTRPSPANPDIPGGAIVASEKVKVEGNVQQEKCILATIMLERLRAATTTGV